MKHVVLFLTVITSLYGSAFSATYYLDAAKGDDAAGTGSSEKPFKSMARVFKTVKPGDTVLLRPGNYGKVTFGKGKGVGAKAGRITYKADPETVKPRPADWFEKGLSRPDPEKPDGQVVFTSIKFEDFARDRNAKAKTGTPEGHYVNLEGVNIVGGNLTLVSYVSEVAVRNVNIFGNWGEYSSEVTGKGVNLYRAYSLGSNYRDILVEGCYVKDCSGGAMLLGNFTNVTLRGCHFDHFTSTALGLNGKMDNVLIEGNHMHHQEELADTVKHKFKVAEADEKNPKLSFTLTDWGHYWDWITVTHADTGKKELREVANFDKATRKITLKKPLDAAPKPGDEAVLWDANHGSGVAVRAGNFTLRGNRIHDCGGTRGIYFYKPGKKGFENIIIENNLIYATKNQYPVDFNKGLGDHCRIANNTFVGRKHGNYESNRSANMYYGLGMIGAKAAPEADPKTITVANNIIVGVASAPKGAVVKNNIVYASGDFEEDNEGDNSGNLVFYKKQPRGQEPHPFDKSGEFFVGGETFEKVAFKKQHGENLNDAFRLAKPAKAVGFADPKLATPTDIAGDKRDGQPDAGAYEYKDDPK